MNKINKKYLEVELHCLERPFKHARLSNLPRLNQLLLLIEQQGQQTPVIVVPHGSDKQRWCLIDGYLRTDALKRLGHDTVLAEVWDCKMADALMAVMAQQQNRGWAALEEAMLLRELRNQFGLSQTSIAQHTGRSKSWVSYRLQLIETLPEKILKAVQAGDISTWVATRIFEPFARANTQHAELFLAYLIQHHHSSRELNDFFSHYKNSSVQVRKHLVSKPALYFQSKRSLMKDVHAKAFAPETERLWFVPLKALSQPLTQLLSSLDKIFYANQPPQERQALLSAFEPLRQQFHSLETKLGERCDAQSRTTPNHSMPTPIG